MRLVSFGPPGCELPGALQDDRILPIGPLLAGFGVRNPEMNAVLGLWGLLGPQVEQALAEAAPDQLLSLTETRLGPPVPRPASILGVGKNYGEPGDGKQKPMLFLMPVTALAGPHDRILTPPESEAVDYEGELAVVIGTAGYRIPVEEAAAHIAGYTVANDVTAFDLMFPGHLDSPGAMSAMLLQQLRGKGQKTFAPTGPWIVTADELADIDEREIRVTVNGAERQRAQVGEMLTKIPELIADASLVVPLQPGDLILTGTPPGIGASQPTPTFLRDDDVVEVNVDGIGAIRNTVATTPVGIDRSR
jgi:acylpyruvate hydrolase